MFSNNQRQALHQTFPLGVRYMLLSAAGFALMGASVKMVSTYGIPLVEIVAARSLISLLISYLDIKRKKLSVWGHNKSLLVARGLVGAIALFCVYYAVTTLPLAEATLIQYLHPAFTAVIALIFLKESVHLSTILCIVLSILGLTLLAQPSLIHQQQTVLPTFSILIAVLGALGSAIAYVLVRKLSQTEDSSVIIFYFPLIALPISLFIPGQQFIMPNIEALGLLILVGIFTQLGQIGLTKAMQNDTASKTTAYSYIQVIFATLLGWIFFAESPSLWTWIGGGLIMAGALINTLWRHE